MQNQNLILSSIGGSNYIANREKNKFTLALPLLRRVKHSYTLPLLCRVQQTNSLVKNYSSINYKTDPIVTKLKDTSLLTVQKLFLQDIKYTLDCPDSKLDCVQFHEENSRNLFRKKLVKQSGIYMLKYKHDNRIFYIGKALDLSVRLRDHYNRSTIFLGTGTNRLAVFLNMVGWSNLSVHIIEFCPETQLDIRENDYLERYLPTLNHKFSSLYSLKTYRSLTSLLMQRQKLNRLKYPQLNKKFNSKSQLWVYSYPELKLLNNLPFDNISKFKKIFNLDNRTLYKYIDTYTSYNGYIFLSADIFNLTPVQTEVLSLNENNKFVNGHFVQEVDQKLILFNSSITPSYKPIKIWVYKSKDLSLVCVQTPERGSAYAALARDK